MPQLPVNWVTSRDVMQHLGIRSQVTLTKLIKEGLPAHKIGKGYRFDLIEVDAWLRGSSRWNRRSAGRSA